MTHSFLNRLKRLKEIAWQFFKSQSIAKKVLLIAGVGFLVACSGVAFLFLLVWSGTFGPLPTKEELNLVKNPAATQVYSADSVLLGRYFIQERSAIRYEDIPKHVENAVLATEDVRFYKHNGIDVKSLIRVVVKTIFLQRESSGGGSTITQQLAKNLYPRKSFRSFSLAINKIREMIIARRIENVMDKKSILTLYLNTIPFGDNTFGIDAAAERFFSVSTRALSVDQCAILVGMLKATHTYNPRIFPERAIRRRNVVLSQMHKYNMLDEKNVNELKALPLKLSYNRITHHSGLAPYFREYIRQELLQWCRTHTKEDGQPYNLYTDGLKVYTTIDSRLQRYAEKAVSSQMAALQKKFAEHWKNREPWNNQPHVVRDAIRRSDRYKRLKQQGASDEEINKIMKTPVPMTVFTWTGEKEMKLSPLDSIKHYLKFLNAGMLVMNPKNGAVRAWVGGINHNYFQYDHVRSSTKRQVGSTFKPIVYAAALEHGARPCDFISAEKTTYTNVHNMEEWSPQNTDDNYDLKYSMEGALAYSVNTVSVKVLEKAGIQQTIALAKKMGIESKMPAVPSLALGVADISMIEMVAAYACFVNRGKAVKPFYLTSINSSRGETLEKFVTGESKFYALSPESAEMMVHMLKRTVDEGTAGRLRWEYGVANDVGGKTGTTQSNADGWFIGITPHLVMGAWVGADDPRIRFRSTALGQGANTALPIVAKFIKHMNGDKEFTSISQARFPKPSELIESDLDCELYKSDLNFWESIFGPSEKKKESKVEKRDFSKVLKRGPERRPKREQKKKDSFFKKLFGKRSQRSSDN